MTERRSHWSDDLIDAVFRIMDDYAAEVWRREWDHGTPTFDIIAAVEDWQVQHARNRLMLVTGNPGTYVGDLEATIQRVRELHRHRMGSRYYVCAECGDNVPYPCATRRLVDDDPLAFLRALDGGGDS